MTRSARWAIAFVVLFVVTSFAVVLLFLTSFGGSHFVPTSGVLHVKLDGEIPELAPHDSLTRALGREAVDLRDLLDALQKAQTDDGIHGVFVEIGSPSLGVAQSEELRAALGRYRKSGKWAWAFLETAGEFQGGNGAYLIAAACDRVILAPPGDVALTGLRSETPFVRGLFDKLGIVPQFGQRKEFKNAPNTYTEKDYTPAHREATGRLLGSIFADVVAAIAAGRRLTPARVRELVAYGPYPGPEAKERGLVDDLMYRDEALDALDRKAGGRTLVGVARYLRGGRPHDGGGPRIAVIYAVGGVNRGRSGSSPFGGDTMGSDTIVAALRRAREDDGVAAVVLRVDSPGGSYVASDIIRREVELTNRAKPVIASMGNVAASGGYFVSMDARKIVADSSTITGSIGVFAGKMVTRDLWEQKLGVHWGGLQEGDNADFWSSVTPYSAKGEERLNAMLDRIYADFTTKAAKGRGLGIEELEPLAHGRVWSGKDALERKLVDRIGGLHEAIELARETAKVGPRYRVEVLPEPQGFLQTLFARDDETRLLPVAVRQVLHKLATETDGREQFLSVPDLPEIR